jgi:hypothetical protein
MLRDLVQPGLITNISFFKSLELGFNESLRFEKYLIYIFFELIVFQIIELKKVVNNFNCLIFFNRPFFTIIIDGSFASFLKLKNFILVIE